MASSIEYLNYVLDLLRNCDNITYKKMMGEFLLYKDESLFGGVYDDRFLIKKTPYTIKLNLSEEVPYEGAKSMLLIDSDNADDIKTIIDNMFNEESK